MRYWNNVVIFNNSHFISENVIPTHFICLNRTDTPNDLGNLTICLRYSGTTDRDGITSGLVQGEEFENQSRKDRLVVRFQLPPKLDMGG